MKRIVGIALSTAAAAGLALAGAHGEPPTGAEPVGSACPTAGPPPVRAHAVPSDTGHYSGYYVGGGLSCRGDNPGPCEGTWGWDYDGLFLPHRIFLLWSHGRRTQGGTGAYRTEGPEPVKRVGELLHGEGGHE